MLFCLRDGHLPIFHFNVSWMVSMQPSHLGNTCCNDWKWYVQFWRVSPTPDITWLSGSHIATSSAATVCNIAELRLFSFLCRNSSLQHATHAFLDGLLYKVRSGTVLIGCHFWQLRILLLGRAWKYPSFSISWWLRTQFSQPYIGVYMGNVHFSHACWC